MIKPEKRAEKAFVRACNKRGFECIKMNTFGQYGRRNLPDRLVLIPWGRAIFIEFKRVGFEPTEAQEECHKKLRQLGFRVYVAHSFAEASEAVEDNIAASKGKVGRTQRLLGVGRSDGRLQLRKNSNAAGDTGAKALAGPPARVDAAKRTNTRR